MKNIFFCIIVGFILVTIGVDVAMAKRMEPIQPESVIYNGVSYSAPRNKMGYVVATDVTSGKVIWATQVYKIIYDNSLERDVQDIFISNLRVEGNTLIVTDERGINYRVDLNGKTNNSNGSPFSKLWLNFTRWLNELFGRF